MTEVRLPRARAVRTTRAQRLAALDDALSARVIVLDGALGTQIDALALSEDDYRGDLFANHPAPLYGDHAVLALTRPEVLRGVHRRYFEAGADIATTASFYANAAGQQWRGLNDRLFELNMAAARVARAAADDAWSETPNWPRFVAGSLGPAADVDGWDDAALARGYFDAARGLYAGGVDLFMIETIGDARNARAALTAVRAVLEEHNARLPVFCSAAGEDFDVNAFCAAIAPLHPDAVGVNCRHGADALSPMARAIASATSARVTIHPNASGPAASPEAMAAELAALARDGVVDVVGGCCGATPAHIAAISGAVLGLTPRSSRTPASQSA